MNIIMAIIGLVGLKRAPECIKMHHFEGENAKIFLTAPSPDPTPVDAFGASSPGGRVNLFQGGKPLIGDQIDVAYGCAT